MGRGIQEKDSMPVDLESGSKPSPHASKGEAGPPAYEAEDGRTTTSINQEEPAEINLTPLTWWKAGIVLVAETVSLGILSLPSVLASLGLVPGIILIIFIAILSGYSGLVFGEFCMRYPEIESFGGVGEVIGRTLGGPATGLVFKEFLGWCQVIFQIFVMGSHLLTWTIALNMLTDSSQCTVMWAGVGLVIFWLCNLPRNLNVASYLSVASSVSIFSAVIVTIVDVAIEKPIGSTSLDVTRQMGFTGAFLSVTNIAIAFCAHSCFFSVISELRVKTDWPKALCMLQALDTSLYLVAAVVIYVYVGPDVPSPALSAAGSEVMRKVIWGIALPTIVIAGVIYGHVAAKYVFGRIFGKTKHFSKRTLVGDVAWVAVALSIWLLAFVISQSIPVFNSLLSLICALFVSWFSYGIPGIMWLFLYRKEYFKNWKMMVGLASNVFLVIAGIMFCALGFWSTVASLDGDSQTRPWSC
ncbi:N amino acid transport system protein [Cytospora mali]|uniref:N amino acid transport system protein n=1 Tax=Cytospora mali TaxID=578113 RepID=A0A194VGS6_CYTMA|nr:N amino acid transport system protein [Valsa mali var. pyri (nom. inval.)]